jgi:hypothetical protein
MQNQTLQLAHEIVVGSGQCWELVVVRCSAAEAGPCWHQLFITVDSLGNSTRSARITLSKGYESAQIWGSLLLLNANEPKHHFRAPPPAGRQV